MSSQIFSLAEDTSCRGRLSVADKRGRGSRVPRGQRISEGQGDEGKRPGGDAAPWESPQGAGFEEEQRGIADRRLTAPPAPGVTRVSEKSRSSA